MLSRSTPWVQGAGHYFEILYLANMRLHSGLEHIDAERTGAVGGDSIACGVDRRGHILNERHHIAQEFHHAAHPHVLECGNAEYGVNRPVDQAFADTLAHFIFGEMSLIEEFFHQSLVVFSGCFHESLMQFLCSFGFFSGNLLDCRHTAFGSP